jgi:hypothetical protein
MDITMPNVPSPFQDRCHLVLERDDGAFRLWLPHPRVVLSRVQGYLRHEYALELIRCLNETAPNTQIFQYHDWLAMDGFDIRCQRDLTSWHITHRGRVGTLQIAAQSGLVRMGVSVANIALKGLIRLHDSSQTLEDAAERMIKSLQ